MNFPKLTLSRARLSIRRGGGEAERRSTAPYLIHQAVADLFGDHTDRGYLFRVTAEWPDGREVLVLSRVPALSLDRVVSPEHRRVVHLESRAFQPPLSAGQLLDYEVRVNATRVVTGPDRDTHGLPKKRRHDIWELLWTADKTDMSRTPHRAYGEWLARQLAGAAEILEAQVTERGEVMACRGDRPNVVRFVAANLIGTLRIQDPTRFLDIIAAGIGRARAFGCGLICLSRPGTVLARHYPERAAELL